MAKLTRKEKFKSAPKSPAIKPVRDSWVPSFLLFMIGFLLYTNTLQHGFTLDDYSIILENRVTKQGVAAIPEIFITSYRYGYYFTDDNLYRPLVKAMFATEWGMAPGSPFPGHLINVLLYALTGIVLFHTLKKITGNKVLFSFITTALFLAHPVHTEVVASIKSRDEILAFLLSIWALERYITALRTNSNMPMIASGIILFVALLSKESAITFLAVLPLTGWFFSNEKPLTLLKKTIPAAVAVLLFLIIRSSVLSGIVPETVSVADNLLAAAKDPVTKFATAVTILGHYLRILIFPHPLVFDYSYNQIPLNGPASPGFLISAILYTGMLVYALLKFKAKSLWSYCILVFLVTLSLYSNIFITIGSSMGERFLYAPSLGFCMALGLVFIKAGKLENSAPDTDLKTLLLSNKVLLTIFCFTLFLYAIKTLNRNLVWKDNFTLYSNDVLLSPNSTRTHYYLGNYLAKPEAWEGKPEAEKRKILYQGIDELRKSIEIFPAFADAHTQMGVAYYKLDNPDSALICYRNALKHNPNYAAIHNNIGTVFFTRGQYQEGIKAFSKAVELDPRYAEAYANLGSSYGMLQDYDTALQHLFSAVKWDPNYAQAYYFIGLTYGFKGDKANENIYLEKAYKLDPALRPK